MRRHYSRVHTEESSQCRPRRGRKKEEEEAEGGRESERSPALVISFGPGGYFICSVSTAEPFALIFAAPMVQ